MFRSNYGGWTQFSNQSKALEDAENWRFEGPGQIQNADELPSPKTLCFQAMVEVKFCRYKRCT